MGWNKIEAPRGGGLQPHEVRVAMGSNRTLSVRIGGDVAAALGWIDPKRVEFLVGDGPNAGKARLQEAKYGGGRRLSEKETGERYLSLRGLPASWNLDERFGGLTCDHAIVDGGLNIALPARLLHKPGFEDDPRAVAEGRGKRIGPAAANLPRR